MKILNYEARSSCNVEKSEEEEEEEEVLRRDDQINMAVVRVIPCCGSVASDWLIALHAFTSENCRLKPQCTHENVIRMNITVDTF